VSDDNQNIRVLPENVINKIAAGEVIDRPSSVVKELVENSIDAQADRITVHLKDGGKTLIQVIDNGVGMAEEDAIMSFQRHATSKIRTFRDIERIHSLGFRGEALASIAAVSRVELSTILRGGIEGTSIHIDGGVIRKLEKTGGNPGTSISVKNIFYNTPARRKFLKADHTEYRHTLSIMNRFTLAYPAIGFTLFHDGHEVFNLKPAPLDVRIGDVLGKRTGENLIAIDDDNAVARLSGYIGNLDIMRKSRNDQYLFVNQRYIVDRTLNFAVSSAFGDAIPKGAYPLYVIFLDIAPDRVDINVHPTKTEAKFLEQQMLFTIMRGAVKRALTSDSAVPELGTHARTDSSGFKRFETSIAVEIKNFRAEQIGIDFDDTTSSSGFALQPEDPKRLISPFSISPAPARSEEPKESVLVWQLHNKYILSQIKSGLIVIDQHVAHERILYEKAKKSFEQKEGASQQLLFPQTVDLSVEDFDYLMDILPFLAKLGFQIKGFGGRTIVIEGVPSGMRVGSEDRILLDILDEYKKKLNTEIDIRERVAKSFSCRSAIMAGERLTSATMNALIDQLFACENPYYCPHGRPVMVTISIDELDKRFDRK
jgi:DNA mismatch repair protein MutL